MLVYTDAYVYMYMHVSIWMIINENTTRIDWRRPWLVTCLKWFVVFPRNLLWLQIRLQTAISKVLSKLLQSLNAGNIRNIVHVRRQTKTQRPFHQQLLNNLFMILTWDVSKSNYRYLNLHTEAFIHLHKSASIGKLSSELITQKMHTCIPTLQYNCSW